jgi:hypothetical protein
MFLKTLRIYLQYHIVLQPRKSQNEAPRYAVSLSSYNFPSKSNCHVKINVAQLGQYISHVLHAIAVFDMHSPPDRRALKFHFSLLLTQRNPQFTLNRPKANYHRYQKKSLSFWNVTCNVDY